MRISVFYLVAYPIVHEKEEGGGTFDIQYLLCLFEGNKKGPARCLNSPRRSV